MAKYIATSVMEVYRDSTVYDNGQITVLECMGRHAGWLTAAAALANVAGCGPDLIYVPEVDFDLDAFTAKVKGIYEKEKKCFVVVSEGIHDKDGTFIAGKYGNENMAKDAFGHAQLGGTAAFLANYIKEQTGAKVRGIELSLLQRCAAHSPVRPISRNPSPPARPRWITPWRALPIRWWASSAAM